ncbi:hypothetical protein BDW59DRAFT_130516 [Aspergillus cavernicola]|uniref:Secreted protein n=1 Tax=Aspergillus cavernicola TaxID=176166 RepID=A0ABR4HQH1_9EURO
MLHSILQILLLFTSGAFSFHDCPRPECSTCLPLSQHMHRLRFDLRLWNVRRAFPQRHHARSCQGGGEQGLQASFFRLSKSPPVPPSDWRAFKRWLNKQLGRPATLRLAFWVTSCISLALPPFRPSKNARAR